MIDVAALRSRQGGIGLSLAGGGPAGAVYEIGALMALQEALDGVDLAALDCYVGVSAGALLCACLANGMSARLLVQIIHGDACGEEPFEPEIFFAPNYLEFVKRGATLPRTIAQALWYFARRLKDRSALASLSRATRALPLGIFDNDPIRRHLVQTFRRHGRTDDFRSLRPKLVVVATDLDAARAVCFGDAGHEHVPISLAVQASTALPGAYAPVRVDGRDCVDGVLLKTLHASVALEHGVGLLLCVNPIVPFDLRAAEQGAPQADGLREHGLPSVLSQTFRTLVHSRMEIGLASYGDRYPDADVVLFEPRRDDCTMFFRNMFNLSARREVCSLAYHATRRDLRARAAELEPVLARHGVRLRMDVLEDDRCAVWSEAESQSGSDDAPVRRERSGQRRAPGASR